MKKFITLAKKLYPINRSITGKGVVKTLKIIKASHLPKLKIKKIKSGTSVYDWKIPPEWNIKNAFIKDESGKKIIDYKKNNLHIVSYSKKINKYVDKKELNKHLFSIPKKPKAIPYVTSYYKTFWGFCLAHQERKKIKGKKFFVHINSNFNNKGFLSYGELYLKGKSSKEILITTYVCHPSMANDEVSGPVVATFVAKYFKNLKNKYSLRFIFIPETIGAIAYIHKHYKKLKKNIIASYCLSCIGDDRSYSIILSKYGSALSDSTALEALKKLKIKYKKYSFLHRGSDERQFNSPGVEIPMTVISRTKFGNYPEYHTSLDNFEVVTEKGLKGGFKVVKKIIDLFQNKIIPVSTVVCEPMLSKRKLYPTTSTLRKNQIHQNEKNILHFMSYSDGKNDLERISTLINLPINKVTKIFKFLIKRNLISEL
tara:strand:- start:42 stop:1322 length:1281 start_codon:yes stop_codon:yes gene_type:complete